MMKQNGWNWDCYGGNLTWLPTNTIFLTEAGSTAYGTNGPDSDIDYRGVVIPPLEYFLGFSKHFEQADKGFEGKDCSIYEIRKAFDLMSDCNPNAIELLFMDEENIVVCGDIWNDIRKHRNVFLSQMAKHRFSGYATAQLKRILGHRRYITSPPTHQPTREEFGLPNFTAIPADQLAAAETQIKKQIEAWQIDLSCVPETSTRIALENRIAETLADMQLNEDKIWEAATNKLGFEDNFLHYLAQERGYRGAMNEWKHYQTWLKERNPIRAELERKYLMDTKHASHLVRLMRMCKEIITLGQVIVKRPDAEELKAIRFEGAWSFEKLIDWAQAQDKELDELLKTSPLPKRADKVLLDEVCLNAIEQKLYHGEE